MRWKILDERCEPLGNHFPELTDTALAIAPIMDYSADLFQLERTELETMAAGRQKGFSSGRYCAHLAQELLGIEPQAIGRQGRMPIWPESCVGSITHSRELAAAITSTAYAGVGIDLEHSGRVNEKHFATVFTAEERECLKDLDADAATVMFSAKEAGYKAIYPINGTYIGFQEARIRLDERSKKFSIEYLGEVAANRLMEKGVGFWSRVEGQVLTVFWIPAGG